MNQQDEKPLIAIIGRTNVGKSTLFNRLAEQGKALVSEIPGTTRDRNYADCVWRGEIIQIVDTGGLQKGKNLELAIEKQVKIASEQADIIYLIVDVKTGPIPEDLRVANFLKKIKKPIIVITNKADTAGLIRKGKDPEWKKLGLGQAVPVSAATGVGVGDLLDITYGKIKELGLKPQSVEEINALKIAILGKPNVGKSSLVNALCGEPRMIVTDIAFTTREPHDTFIKYNDDNYVLIDTAGIRKHAKIAKGLEEKGVRKTKAVLDQADIALLVLDISEPLGAQDRKLANLILESNKALIIVGNKMDILEKQKISSQETTDYIYSFLTFISWAPLVLCSAKTGKNVKNIFKVAQEVKAEHIKTIPATALDRLLKAAIKKAKPIGGPGMVKSPRVLGLKQKDIAPPSFEVPVAPKEVLHTNYLKYLEKQLRKKFGFTGTPIIIRSKSLDK